MYCGVCTDRNVVGKFCVLLSSQLTTTQCYASCDLLTLAN